MERDIWTIQRELRQEMIETSPSERDERDRREREKRGETETEKTNYEPQTG